MDKSFLSVFILALLLTLGYRVNCGVIDSPDADKVPEEEAIENRVKGGAKIVQDEDTQSPQVAFVNVSNDEIQALIGSSATLPCEFKIYPASDEPVTITWRIGDGPRESTPISYCHDFVGDTCRSFEVVDYAFNGRISMIGDKAPSLVIHEIKGDDNHNFWCEVQTQSLSELGTDMKSVVLRVVKSDDERPKFDRVELGAETMLGKVGQTIIFDCSCTGYHCDNVYWYKGPVYSKADGSASYVTIYSKENRFNRNPVIIYGEEYKDRITIQGYSLALDNAQESDSGRYWCEARGADFYTLGDTGTDAKSLVLSVEV